MFSWLLVSLFLFLSPLFAAPERVVLVTIDTLRYDHLPFSGYPRNTAPFLDHMAKTGVLFENTYSATSHTAPSLASFLTSLLPFQHGVLRNGEQIADGIPTLPSLLKEAGFKSGAFSSVRFLEPLGKTFDEFKAAEKEGKFYWFIQGETVMEKAKAWVKERKGGEKIFVWIHLYDVHQRLGTQYDYSSDKKALLADHTWNRADALEYYYREHGTNANFLKREKVDLVELMDDYDGRIRYVDRQIKEFYEFMESRYPLGETLWIISADHGEGLGSHDYMGHGRFLYQEQLRVPLIFHSSKKAKSGKRISASVRTIDVMPTVLVEAGLGPALKGLNIEGRPLNSFFDSAPAVSVAPLVFAQRRPVNKARLNEGWEKGIVLSIVKEPYKLIYRSEYKNELFDLKADPLEKENLSGKKKGEEQGLLRLLKAKFSSFLDAGGDLPEQAGRSEFLEQLKTLGYAN